MDSIEKVAAHSKHFAIDSRQVQKGSLFFALPGEKFDGHQFLDEVSRKGAYGAVVKIGYMGPDFGLKLAYVSDVKLALQELAKKTKRPEKVVAITGSMGKTTTKEFLATLLEAKFRVGKTEGNQNTQVTLPLTLLNLQEECDVLILEMGMGAPGDIARLVEIAPPDLVIVTRIAPAGMVASLESISKAKGEIFSSKRTKRGIISWQAAEYPEILYGGGIPKWIYGWRDDLKDVRAADFVMEEGLFINDSPKIEVSFEGKHLQENFLAAVAAARALGLSWQDIASRAKLCKPYERRFEKSERDGVVFINDCYNANPHSVVAALKNLPKPKRGGKVVGVLGAMPDLGKESTKYHQEVGKVASEHLDRVFCIGDEAMEIANSFGKGAEHLKSVKEVQKALEEMISSGDVVLIKGGNGLKLWEILEG